MSPFLSSFVSSISFSCSFFLLISFVFLFPSHKKCGLNQTLVHLVREESKRVLPLATRCVFQITTIHHVGRNSFDTTVRGLYSFPSLSLSLKYFSKILILLSFIGYPVRLIFVLLWFFKILVSSFILFRIWSFVLLLILHAFLFC